MANSNLKVPTGLSPEKQAQVDAILKQYEDENKRIEREHWKNMGRIRLGGLVQAASAHPVFNVPYIGTGLGGALFDMGGAIMEGDKLPDIAKKAGQGFVIGETVGAIPYVGKVAGKTKAGQAVVKNVGRGLEAFNNTGLGQKVGQGLAKAEDILMSDIRGLNPNKQTVYHGSPYDFNKFSNEAIGTGEGAQAHGYGHYSALNRETAERYLPEITSKENIPQYIIDKYSSLKSHKNLLENFRETRGELPDNLKQVLENTNNKLLNLERNYNFSNNQGQLYKLSIPKDDLMLREDVLLSEQPQIYADIYNEMVKNNPEKYKNLPFKKLAGRDLYFQLQRDLGSDKAATEYLQNKGIKGISYNGDIDGESRVIFNPDDIDIVRKYYNQPTINDIINKNVNMGTFINALLGGQEQ